MKTLTVGDREFVVSDTVVHHVLAYWYLLYSLGRTDHGVPFPAHTDAGATSFETQPFQNLPWRVAKIVLTLSSYSSYKDTNVGVGRDGAHSGKIALWENDGVPTRLVWAGQRYRINDRPTQLGGPSELIWYPTHLPPTWIGWRFQAVGDDGKSLVFDEQLDETAGEWELLWVYD